MIDVKCGVVVYIPENLISVEVDEDSIFLDFKAVDFEKSDTVLFSVLNLSILHL
jgi:hypothetical protein